MIEQFPIGLTLVKPRVFTDGRGYFFESYSKNRLLQEQGISADFIQDNESKSAKGIMRGLHWQAGEHAQAKLVRVINGAVVDFVLDLRSDSKFFGQMAYFYLSAENKVQLFVPKGFAHGFIALENDTIFSYKVDSYYCKESERGISILSPELNIFNGIQSLLNDIQQPSIDFSNIVMSEKDKAHPSASDVLPLMKDSREFLVD